MKPFHTLLLVDSAIVFSGVLGYVSLLPGHSSTEAAASPPQANVSMTTAHVAQTDGSVDGTHRDTLALRQDITRLRSEVASLKGQLQALGQTVSAMPLDVADQELGAMDASELEPPEDLLMQHQQRIGFIEADFRAEHVDSAWSDSTTKLIEETLTVEELAGTAVYDVQCRSNMCRLEIQHDDPLAQMEFEHQFPMAVGDALPRITMDQIDGGDGLPGLTVVYLSREDYRFGEH